MKCPEADRLEEQVTAILQLVYGLKKLIGNKKSCMELNFVSCLGQGTDTCRHMLCSADQVDNHLPESQQSDIEELVLKLVSHMSKIS